nr:hypothetical protein [Bacteroidota bacterium]
MRKLIYALISVVILAATIPNISSAQSVTGDLKFWQMSDFLGFDQVGDCNATTADISSVYARIDENKLFLRVTFDNMVSREHNEIVEDHFNHTGISLGLSLVRQSDRTTFLQQSFNLATLSTSDRNYYSLRTPGKNLWELEIILPEEADRADLEFNLTIEMDGKVVDYFLSDGRNSDA